MMTIFQYLEWHSWIFGHKIIKQALNDQSNFELDSSLAKLSFSWILALIIWLILERQLIFTWKLIIPFVKPHMKSSASFLWLFFYVVCVCAHEDQKEDSEHL